MAPHAITASGWRSKWRRIVDCIWTGERPESRSLFASITETTLKLRKIIPNRTVFRQCCVHSTRLCKSGCDQLYGHRTLSEDIYYYRVWARNTVGDLPYSNVASAMTFNASVVAVSTGLAATPGSASYFSSRRKGINRAGMR